MAIEHSYSSHCQYEAWNCWTLSSWASCSCRWRSLQTEPALVLANEAILADQSTRFCLGCLKYFNFFDLSRHFIYWWNKRFLSCFFNGISLLSYMMYLWYQLDHCLFWTSFRPIYHLCQLGLGQVASAECRLQNCRSLGTLASLLLWVLEQRCSIDFSGLIPDSKNFSILKTCCFLDSLSNSIPLIFYYLPWSWSEDWGTVGGSDRMESSFGVGTHPCTSCA